MGGSKGVKKKKKRGVTRKSPQKVFLNRESFIRADRGGGSSAKSEKKGALFLGVAMSEKKNTSRTSQKGKDDIVSTKKRGPRFEQASLEQPVPEKKGGSVGTKTKEVCSKGPL